MSEKTNGKLEGISVRNHFFKSKNHKDVNYQGKVEQLFKYQITWTKTAIY